ncbi:MAG: hypothetical protein ACI9J5_003357, partial [Paraglaciecola sp.]
MKIINTFIASLILVSLMPLVAQAEVGSDKQPIRVFPPYTIETL